MSRKTARISVFKLVFEYVINEEYNELSLQNALEETEDGDDKLYITTTYTGIVHEYQSIKDEIEKYAKGFSIDRVFPVDLAILVLAIYEIKYNKDIPFNVSVNEALNISKVYSTEKSTQYINGILKNFKKE